MKPISLALALGIVMGLVMGFQIAERRQRVQMVRCEELKQADKPGIYACLPMNSLEP